MTEAYLHYLFESKKLGKSFQTTNKEEIEVIEFGTLNKSSGPDFVEAKIRFDSKIWAGHIEFHLKSSDWNKHGHQNDAAYENVIAHFVLEHDQEVIINKFRLPVVELRNKIDKPAYENYKKLVRSKNWVACEGMVSTLDKKIINQQLLGASQQRSDRKAQEVRRLYKASNHDPMTVIVKLIAKVLGGNFNANAMIELHNRIDLDYLKKVNFDYDKMSSYLLNLSGLGRVDSTSMSPTYWRTYGMRPPSQPKPRIRQLTQIISDLNLKGVPGTVSDWKRFLNGVGENSGVVLSKQLQAQIWINCIIPLLGINEVAEKEATEGKSSFSLLSNLPAEKNAIVMKWSQLGIVASNAKDSQALIELKNEFCSKKKCLFCSIGKSLLVQ